MSRSEPRIDWSGSSSRAVIDVHPSAYIRSSGDRPSGDPRYDGSASERQISYLLDLGNLTGKINEVTAEIAKGRGPSKARASALIARLLELKDQLAAAPAASAAAPSAEGTDLRGLSGGYYAATLGGVTKFFKVDVVTEGRWDGWIFVRLQASDDLHKQGSQKPGQLYTGASRDYLAAIVADEQAAYRLYGSELGTCGVCGRTLTDETSRAFGVGPICREKMGY